LQQQQQKYTTSVSLIRKWQEILSNVHNEQQTNNPALQADELRQLLKDAIHVYKTEGAAAVVPDQVRRCWLCCVSKWCKRHSHKCQLES
jgi:hypothetical protein